MQTSIHEVLTCGPIIFHHPETDTLITINGSYLNWWAGDYSGNYDDTDCRSLSYEGGLYSLDMTEAMREAENYFNDMSEGDVTVTDLEK